MTAKRKPVRTCVGCRKQGLKPDLVRFVRSADGHLAPDPSGKSPGRGAYVHPDTACVQLARKRGVKIASV
jgi:hypothetical protein